MTLNSLDSYHDTRFYVRKNPKTNPMKLTPLDVVNTDA